MFRTPLLSALAVVASAQINFAQAAHAPLNAQTGATQAAAQDNVQLLAREAGSRGRGRGRDDARGHGHMDEDASDLMQMAREAGSRGRGRGRDDARGHGHADEDAGAPLQMAREASEAPRGQDNERRGDRQRRNRGGRG